MAVVEKKRKDALKAPYGRKVSLKSEDRLSSDRLTAPTCCCYVGVNKNSSMEILIREPD